MAQMFERVGGQPGWLRWTTILMAICNVFGIVFIDWRSGHLALDLAGCLVIMAVSAIVLRSYWLGRNWARILVLLTSILAVANLTYFFEFGLLGRLLIFTEAVLGLFLLYWLNTRHVRSYFR